MSVMKFPELMDHKMPTLMTVASFAIYRCSESAGRGTHDRLLIIKTQRLWRARRADNTAQYHDIAWCQFEFPAQLW